MEDSVAIEKFIGRSYTEPEMSKIVRVTSSPAVSPGENFLSGIWRLSVTVLFNNGQVKERNFIFKKLPIEEEKRVLVVSTKAFETEILMYGLVLKKMDGIMTEFGNLEERPWCGLILHDNLESVLLQDLKPLGYTSISYANGLTLEEAQLVFRSIAQFHAVSKVLMERGDIQPTIFNPRKTSYHPTYIELFVVKAIRNASRAIEESWGPEWKGLATKLNQPTELIVRKTIETCTLDQSKFNVVLHGDLWTNNILFKRDESGAPASVKFIDLQLSFYNSACWDLTYFAITSLSRSQRKTHWDHLLKLYLNTLQQNLEAYGYPKEKIPIYEYFIGEMKRLRFWALITIVLYSSIFLSGITGNREDAKVIMDANNVSVVPEIYRTQLFKEFAGEELMDIIKEGVMD